MNFGETTFTKAETNPIKVHNPIKSYDLWQDLCKAKVDNYFGKLIQIAPSLRKEMREGVVNHRRPNSMSIVIKVTL